MKFSETELKKIIEGSTQFFVPHYQRAYSWRLKQWQHLWEDLVFLVEERAAPDLVGCGDQWFVETRV